MLNLNVIVGLQAGAIIGLPPVLNFGSPELKARVIPEVLSGKKFICLAISEAFAGSDVMGLKTTAKKTEDGKHWIISGTKKWITNGVYVGPLLPLSESSFERDVVDLRTISPSGAKPMTA
jgi:alkylation response protein AidB-like acyl-CoA dehydrogenase